MLFHPAQSPHLLQAGTSACARLRIVNAVLLRQPLQTGRAEQIHVDLQIFRPFFGVDVTLQCSTTLTMVFARTTLDFSTHAILWTCSEEVSGVCALNMQARAVYQDMTIRLFPQSILAQQHTCKAETSPPQAWLNLGSTGMTQPVAYARHFLCLIGIYMLQCCKCYLRCVPGIVSLTPSCVSSPEQNLSFSAQGKQGSCPFWSSHYLALPWWEMPA